MTPRPAPKRHNPLGGCMAASVTLVFITGAFVLLLPRIANTAGQEEKPQHTQAAPNATETQRPATITQTSTADWLGTKQAADAKAAELLVQAKELENRIKSDDATSIARITETAANDARTATVMAYASAQPATRTAVHGAAVAIAQRNADEAEQQKIDREIDAGKRVLWEIAVPLFVTVLFGLLAFAGLASFGKAVLDDVKNPKPVVFETYDAGETELEFAPACPTTIEVSSPSRNSIIRSKADETIMKILPVFAEYATGLAAADESANPLTDGEWAGEGKRGVTKPEWYKFRNWLIENGFARWKNERAHTLGAELTDERGWPLMKRIAEGNPPSPTELGIK
ncbi:MAG: hypothetical protein ACOYYS_10190 [Chloroflexota bacterium]